MSPKFSIVILTIGRLDLIRHALYSALRQQDHFDDDEIVVLDNRLRSFIILVGKCEGT